MNITPSPKITLEEYKNLKKADVNKIRNLKLSLPILFNNNLFDVDAKSLKNLSYWHLQINSGIELPPDFSWRDYNNIDHIIDENFITDLSYAITMKGTAIYKASWLHKANIENLTTFAEVDAYDVEANWPE